MLPCIPGHCSKDLPACCFHVGQETLLAQVLPDVAVFRGRQPLSICQVRKKGVSELILQLCGCVCWGGKSIQRLSQVILIFRGIHEHKHGLLQVCVQVVVHVPEPSQSLANKIHRVVEKEWATSIEESLGDACAKLVGLRLIQLCSVWGFGKEKCQVVGVSPPLSITMVLHLLANLFDANLQRKHGDGTQLVCAPEFSRRVNEVVNAPSGHVAQVAQKAFALCDEFSIVPGAAWFIQLHMPTAI
mmetsp:Transcript_66147/g.154929  ORF Transcript_66147/g.154929 Transcript_66147/m.154929 type:complete len:244 (-) Transcript_66147:684-1415(-)